MDARMDGRVRQTTCLQEVVDDMGNPRRATWATTCSVQPGLEWKTGLTLFAAYP